MEFLMKHFSQVNRFIFTLVLLVVHNKSLCEGRGDVGNQGGDGRQEMRLWCVRMWLLNVRRQDGRRRPEEYDQGRLESSRTEKLNTNLVKRQKKWEWSIILVRMETEWLEAILSCLLLIFLTMLTRAAHTTRLKHSWHLPCKQIITVQ